MIFAQWRSSLISNNTGISKINAEKQVVLHSLTFTKITMGPKNINLRIIIDAFKYPSMPFATLCEIKVILGHEIKNGLM